MVRLKAKRGHFFYFSLLVLFIPLASNSKTLFVESFDEQPNWTSDSFISDGTLPANWSAHRTDDRWSPGTGYPDHHASAEISSTNSGKARGGKGKALVAWRESYDPGWKKWNSDSILVKYLESDQKELYVEFYISFSKEMIQSFYSNGLGSSKLFRVYNFNGNYGDRFQFFGDINSPKYLWDISGTTKYGVRNAMSIYARGPNHGENGDIPGLPKKIGYSGDLSLSYKTNLTGMATDGSDAKLENKLTEESITDQANAAMIDEVFGPAGTWTKMAFYIRMNSGPGVQDGVLMQWLDNQRIFSNKNIDWVRAGYDLVGWNAVAFTGNDFFNLHANSEKYEEWYAIDDIKISTEVPDGLLEGTQDGRRPEPPSNLLIK